MIPLVASLAAPNTLSLLMMLFTFLGFGCCSSTGMSSLLVTKWTYSTASVRLTVKNEQKMIMMMK